VEVLNPKHQILNNIKIQKSKDKKQNDNSKRKNVVRGFSLVHERKAASRVVEITPFIPLILRGKECTTLKGRTTEMWSICSNLGESDKISISKTGDEYDSCREDIS
jgi:hypothetical protein